MLSENFGITLDTVIDDFRTRIVQLACFNYEQNLAFIVSKKTVIILKEIEQFIHENPEDKILNYCIRG